MGSHARWSLLVAVCLGAPACFHDTMNASASLADASSSSSAATSSTSTATEPASDESTTTPVDPTTGPAATATTTPDTTTTPDGTTTTTSSSSTNDGTTTAPLGCDDIVVIILLDAEKALLTDPMQKTQNDEEGTIAYSLVAGEGTAEFSFDIQCAGTYHVWGRVLDLSPGADFGQDPDSFTASIDGDAKIEWLYGCTSESPWSWQRVQEIDSLVCFNPNAWTLDLAPGPHTITLGNLEEGVLDKYAAVARILVTNDPNFVPTTE